MNKFPTKFAIIFIAINMFFCFEGNAQEGFGAKGKDFVLAFLPNYHNNFRNELKMYDSLSLYFVSELPTKINVSFRNRQGIDFSVDLEITDPKVIKEFKLSAYDYELWGLNLSGVLGNNNQCETKARNTFRIRSEQDIIVYAHNQAETTSESMLVLPVAVLNNYYIVLAYPSDDQTKLSSQGKTPSQFVIVASENNTKVTIKPSAPTHVNGMKEQNITLNAGEAYLVQARILSSAVNMYDLTGSEVISDKPVAVISGHQRTSIRSYSEFDKSSSRDCLMEQMTPVASWGNNAAVIPFYQPPSITNVSNEDLFRILASEDNTVITLNKTDTLRLNKKQMYEGEIIKPYLIESNKPIMVASFKKTAKETQGYDNSVSDPLMLANPPMDRVGNYYRFINLQAYERGEFGFAEKVYLNHYVGVVIRESGIKTLKLDGKLVNKDEFLPIPNTNLMYANLEVPEGIHEILSKIPFSILVYGYGYANSYGYIGGMVFRKIDTDAPNLQANKKCYEIKGVVTDSLFDDSGLVDIYSNKSNEINVDLNIDTFSKYAKIVNFDAKLKNQFQDGNFELVAIDSMGFESSEIYEIPGFTVGVSEMQNSITNDIPLAKSDTLFMKKDFCVDFTLENYGKYPQTINKISMKKPNSVFAINKYAPFTLQPNEKISFTVCDSVEIEGTFIDSLVIEGDCADRTILAVNLTRIDDNNDPKVTTQLGNCNRFVDIIITDSTKSDAGIMIVNFIDSTNCSLKEEIWTSKIYSAVLEVIDPTKDAYYEFTSVDSIGNNTTVSGSIPGFTIQLNKFENSSAESNNYEFGNVVIGGMICKEIEVYNYGNFTFNIDQLSTYENTKFSIPASQFPMQIQPKSAKNINVCFSYYKAGSEFHRDTFSIGFNCLEIVAPLEAKVDTLFLNPDSKCDLSIIISADKAPFETYIKQSKPNPASSIAKIEFGLSENTSIKINFYSILGELKHSINQSELTTGNYEISIDVSNFENGNYYYQMITNTGIYSGKMNVSH